MAACSFKSGLERAGDIRCPHQDHLGRINPEFSKARRIRGAMFPIKGSVADPQLRAAFGHVHQGQDPACHGHAPDAGTGIELMHRFACQRELRPRIRVAMGQWSWHESYDGTTECSCYVLIISNPPQESSGD